MKHLKTFENITSKFKVGDYVYPIPEQSWSKFQVLKPQKYKILRIFNKYGDEWFELEGIDPKHDNQFISEWFITPEEFDANKYNL